MLLSFAAAIGAPRRWWMCITRGHGRRTNLRLVVHSLGAQWRDVRSSRVRQPIKEATMSRLKVRCGHCGTGFAMRDNGYEDPAAGIWCPRCGSRNVESWEVPARPERPEAAA